jgi:hypothetical protein
MEDQRTALNESNSPETLLLERRPNTASQSTHFTFHDIVQHRLPLPPQLPHSKHCNEYRARFLGTISFLSTSYKYLAHH